MFFKRFLITIALLLGVADPAAASVKPFFLYYLSNFQGTVHSNWAVVQVDPNRDEIYVLDPREQDVRVFNEKGMEIYRFGEDGSLGTMQDLAVEDDGNLLVLSRGVSNTSILRCNFRGEPRSTVSLQNLPEDFSPFTPGYLGYRDGRIYLLDPAALKIVVTDSNGVFQQGYDIGHLVDVEDSKREETEPGGFSVDREGNMLFTIPVFFAAYRLSPDGLIEGFGRSGSAPGRFGVVGDIEADDQGNLYVADRLKCVVLVFDRNFKFQTEFGYRGPQDDNFIGPKNLAMDSQNRLYVSQLAGRGISVFQLTYQGMRTENRGKEVTEDTR